MKLSVIAVGRARGHPTAALIEDWRRRLPWPLTVTEVEAKGALPPAQLAEREAALLLEALPKGERRLVVLDQGGEALSSEAFAARLGRWAEDGVPQAAFLIGGAYGHGASVRAAADLALSLGPMTLPHLLARAVLVEQLYRAHAILAGHPYHHG